MSTINFTSGNILGNEELVQNNVFLRKSLQSIISNLGVSKGVVKQRGTGNQLLVNVGTNTIGGYNTLKVNTGDIVATRNAAARDAIIDNNVLANLTGLIGTDLMPDVCSLVAGDNIQIPNIGTYNQNDVLYVGVHPYLTVLEEGTVNVSTAGQVTFSNANVTKRLRSHVSNSPTKIRIYQNESASPVQQKEFEVVSIDSDTTITIDGVFPSALTDYRVAIVGSYDLIESPSLVNRFAYASVIGRLAFATTLGGFTYDSVPIAKLIFNADQTFSIVDIRDNYVFYLNTGAAEAVDITSQFTFNAARVNVVADNKVFIEYYPGGRIRLFGVLFFNGSSATLKFNAGTIPYPTFNKLIRTGICDLAINDEQSWDVVPTFTTPKMAVYSSVENLSGLNLIVDLKVETTISAQGYNFNVWLQENTSIY